MTAGPPVPPAWDTEPDGSDLDGLRTLLRRQKHTLTQVATGTSIETKNEEYTDRSERIRQAYRRLGIENPFPWADLWVFWSYIAKWPSWAERRAELAELLDEALDQLSTLDQDTIPSWDLPADEKWRPLAERASDLKSEYESAESIDDHQDVGRRARQIIIEAVKLAWEPSMVEGDEKPPKGDDAKVKLDQVLGVRISGPGYERVRKFIRSALDLGHETTHSEGQEGLEAMASAMGAMMAVRLLQELDQPPDESVTGAEWPDESPPPEAYVEPVPQEWEW
ncbi:MAG TPA: hypothetical protein VFS66_12780 [Acidimicrobiia bacterium]|nr:hypothetical protein [Acidimicrobiia bacterium]